MKSKKLKKEIIEWVIFFSVIGFLFLTGLHTTVFGNIQRVILSTGILRPDLDDEPITASYNLLLEDIDGNEVSLEEWRSETIFMNYWATWCAPCIAEMPDINELYNTVNEEIKFAIISVDDDQEKAKNFIKKRGFDFPIYFLKTRRPEVYRSQAIPTTYVISPEGEVVVSNKGMAQYSNRKFVEYLRSL